MVVRKLNQRKKQLWLDLQGIRIVAIHQSFPDEEEAKMPRGTCVKGRSSPTLDETLSGRWRILLVEEIPFPTTVWMYKTLQYFPNLPYQLVSHLFPSTVRLRCFLLWHVPISSKNSIYLIYLP